MLQAQDFSSLIDSIYDAALDPALWPAALKSAAMFVGGAAAELTTRDTLDNGIVFCLTSGAEASSGESETLTMMLDKTSSSVSTFTVSAGDALSFHNMHLVAPHLRRAMLMSRSMELKAAEAATLADALDGLSAATFLVDADGRMTHANASGDRLLAAAELVRIRSGRLVACDVQSDQAFRKAITTAAVGGLQTQERGVSVPLTARSGERYVAHILTLPMTAGRRSATRQSAVAAIFVHKATLEARSPSSIIAQIFNLTPSELRVLLAIVQVGGVPETAEALGVAETTVKTHLQRVFGKTGTARQAELVKVVASFSSPLIA